MQVLIRKKHYPRGKIPPQHIFHFAHNISIIKELTTTEKIAPNIHNIHLILPATYIQFISSIACLRPSITVKDGGEHEGGAVEERAL